MQFGDKKAKVEKIRAVSKEFSTYIENLKTEFTKELVRDADGNLPFEAMDKGDKVDEKLFVGDKPSPKGKEFLDKIANYVVQIKKIGGSSIADVEMKNFMQ